MLVSHAVFPIDPEKRDEAEKLVEKSNQEDGTIEYRAAWDVSDPNVLRLFEHYEDEAAFEAHLGTDHFAEFEAAIPGLLAGEPEVTRFAIASTCELEL